MKIIFPNLDPQGAFLEEREIIGVALVANEVGKYKSKHKEVLPKTDFEKEYMIM